MWSNSLRFKITWIMIFRIGLYFPLFFILHIIHIVFPWPNILMRIFYHFQPLFLHHWPGQAFYFVFVISLRLLSFLGILTLLTGHFNVLFDLYCFHFWKSYSPFLSVLYIFSQLGSCLFPFRKFKSIHIFICC